MKGVPLHTIYDQFRTVVHDFNPKSEQDIDDLSELMSIGPRFPFVEVTSGHVKFQDDLNTTRPEMSITIMPVEGDEFSRQNIMDILSCSPEFCIPKNLNEVRRKLAPIRLDSGAVFSNTDEIRFRGNSFYALSHDRAR